MRVPKPWFRKQTKSWFVQLDGRQVPLGKDKEAAFRKFHALMAGRRTGEIHRVDELLDEYLEFVKNNRAPETYRGCQRYLSDFNRTIPNKRIHDLKPHDVQRWVNTHEWGQTTQANAIKTVKAALHWAIDAGLIGVSPLARLRAPTALARETLVSDQQWAVIEAKAKPDLLDILTFLRETGARPQEARVIEAVHVLGDRIELTRKLSKGGTRKRVIWLTPEMQQLVQRRMGDGRIFTTAKGKPWTSDRLRQRCMELKLPFPFFPYALRHTFATNALVGSMDSVTVAQLMGHRDTTMISRVYGHLIQRPDYLQDAAIRAAKTTGVADAAPAD